HYLTPKQGLVRLQKIMDEYAAGTSAWYTTNAPTLQRGIELIEMLRADLQHLAARNLHELLRCWELWHRVWVGEAHMRHMLCRQETRWPGYYYRADFPALDDANCRGFFPPLPNPASNPLAAAQPCSQHNPPTPP